MKLPRRQFLHLATGAAALLTVSRIASQAGANRYILRHVNLKLQLGKQCRIQCTTSRHPSVAYRVAQGIRIPGEVRVSGQVRGTHPVLGNKYHSESCTPRGAQAQDVFSRPQQPDLQASLATF
jgi:hypothetical protein